VAGSVRQGSSLAPAGHPPVDDPWVLGRALDRPETESFCHARAKALEDRVGNAAHAEDDSDTLGVLQIQGERTSVPEEHAVQTVTCLGSRPLDADDLRTHVGQHHSAEGSRSDSTQFHDANAIQRPH
jgi:hypothetical protein